MEENRWNKKESQGYFIFKAEKHRIAVGKDRETEAKGRWGVPETIESLGSKGADQTKYWVVEERLWR
jgi:hypothetical protein